MTAVSIVLTGDDRSRIVSAARPASDVLIVRDAESFQRLLDLSRANQHHRDTNQVEGDLRSVVFLLDPDPLHAGIDGSPNATQGNPVYRVLTSVVDKCRHAAHRIARRSA